MYSYKVDWLGSDARFFVIIIIFFFCSKLSEGKRSFFYFLIIRGTCFNISWTRMSQSAWNSWLTFRKRSFQAFLLWQRLNGQCSGGVSLIIRAKYPSLRLGFRKTFKRTIVLDSNFLESLLLKFLSKSIFGCKNVRVYGKRREFSGGVLAKRRQDILRKLPWLCLKAQLEET